MADKQILARYVHDALDMEMRKHTLEQIRNKLKAEESTIVVKTEIADKKEIESLEKNLNRCKQELAKETPHINKKEEEILKERDELAEKIDKANSWLKNNSNQRIWIDWYEIGWFALHALFVLPMIFFAALALYLSDTNLDHNSNAFIIIPIIISVLVYAAVIFVRIIIECVDDKKRTESWTRSYRRDVSELSPKVEKLENEYNRIHSQNAKIIDNLNAAITRTEAQLANAVNNYKNNRIIAVNRAAYLSNVLVDVREKITTVSKQLNEFYSMKLIPPDYRSLECVIAFDQMFRNDLVDNIRQAALLYEERVFRGEMIKGLDNIYRAINTLSGLMAETVSTLRFIAGKTNTMCEELFNISSDIARMNANVTGHLTTISENISSVNSNLGTISDNQQTISAELKYSRYANEAIRANSDRMIWYAEQRRQGLL